MEKINQLTKVFYAYNPKVHYIKQIVDRNSIRIGLYFISPIFLSLCSTVDTFVVSLIPPYTS